MKDNGIFYGHLVHLRSFVTFYGHLVQFVAIWYIFTCFGILKPRKIWQPCAGYGCTILALSNRMAPSLVCRRFQIQSKLLLLSFIRNSGRGSSPGLPDGLFSNQKS
jgi:hypothetical protein